ncbi:MAG: SIS domain-containing protein [Streptosporangiaceae bacterium]
MTGLDDAAAIEAADPGEMLRQVASSAAQIRESVRQCAESGLGRITRADRPRAIVVVGMGAAGSAGDILAAVCGIGCPVPIIQVRGHRLPGWVGAADLVLAVSCSGRTEETVAVATEAVRRGTPLVGVSAAESPLAQIAVQSRSIHVPVRYAGQARATLWAMAVPLLVVARQLGLADVPDEVLERTAVLLEDVSGRCRPSSEPFLNPAKQIAQDLVGAVPMAWGSSQLAGAAAYRLACQINENAKHPCTHGAIPEVGHNQLMAIEGALVAADADDFFRDRSEEAEARLHVLVLRDTEEHPREALRRKVSVEMARARGVTVSEIRAEGEHPLERIASLIALCDYVSVYLAIALDVDPTPVAASRELKARIE